MSRFLRSVCLLGEKLLVTGISRAGHRCPGTDVLGRRVGCDDYQVDDRELRILVQHSLLHGRDGSLPLSTLVIEPPPIGHRFRLSGSTCKIVARSPSYSEPVAAMFFAKSSQDGFGEVSALRLLAWFLLAWFSLASGLQPATMNMDKQASFHR
jgi:hypothetical protein